MNFKSRKMRFTISPLDSNRKLLKIRVFFASDQVNTFPPEEREVLFTVHAQVGWRKVVASIGSMSSDFSSLKGTVSRDFRPLFCCCSKHSSIHGPLINQLKHLSRFIRGPGRGFVLNQINQFRRKYRFGNRSLAVTPATESEKLYPLSFYFLFSGKLIFSTSVGSVKFFQIL